MLAWRCMARVCVGPAYAGLSECPRFSASEDDEEELSTRIALWIDAGQDRRNKDLIVLKGERGECASRDSCKRPNETWNWLSLPFLFRKLYAGSCESTRHFDFSE